MNIPEKQKLYILAGIVGIIAVFIYYQFLFKPLLSKLIVKNREYSALKTKVRNARLLIANENNIKAQYSNVKQQADYLEKRLPSQDRISNLLEDFSSIAESTGVKILRLKPLEEADNNDGKSKETGGIYFKLPILIEARGGYHQIGSFINKLENMERFIRINDMDIKGNERDVRHHDIKMRLVTYVLK